MSTPFMGQIEIFAFNFAPKGWAQCNGQLLSINQNKALFALLGTMYGGNGQTNFALPDLRGRVPISFGSNPLGTAGGQEFHTLVMSETPQHNHSLMADGTTAATSNLSTPGASGSSVLGNSGGSQSPGAPFTVSIYNTTGPNN